jgi:hypothetical protein
LAIDADGQFCIVGGDGCGKQLLIRNRESGDCRRALKGRAHLDRAWLHAEGEATGADGKWLGRKKATLAAMVKTLGSFEAQIATAAITGLSLCRLADSALYTNGTQQYTATLPIRTRVADIYGALTENRSYRAGMTHEEVRVAMARDVPHKIDADCFEALFRSLERDQF